MEFGSKLLVSIYTDVYKEPGTLCIVRNLYLSLFLYLSLTHTHMHAYTTHTHARISHIHTHLITFTDDEDKNIVIKNVEASKNSF